MNEGISGKSGDDIFLAATRALYENDHESAAHLYRQALAEGLTDGRDEVFAQGALCVALWALDCSEEAVKAGETALELDSERGYGEFQKKQFRDMVFRVLETEWTLGESKRLKRKEDTQTALEYMLSKLSLLSYLPGTYMPVAHIRVADLTFDLNNMGQAKAYYRLGLDADPPFDPEDGGPEFYAKMRAHAHARWQAMGGESGCWIASVAYGSESAEVQVLRDFRNRVLLPTPWGRTLSWIYYHTGPSIAASMARNKLFAQVVRDIIVRPVLEIARRVR